MSLYQIMLLGGEALLGLVIAYAAYSLFSSTPPSVAKMRAALHYPRWYWVLAGIMATIGAVGLLIGMAIPLIEASAALWMAGYFVVATGTHLLRKDWTNLGAPVLFLAIFAGLVALRWADAQPLLALIGM